MIAPVRWKPIRGFPLYEISDEGQVRMTLDNPQTPGHVKRRYRVVYQGVSDNRLCKQIAYNKSINMRGTLYVDMTNGTLGEIGIGKLHKVGNRKKGNPRFRRSIADLMDLYWPGMPYPEHWRSDRTVILDPKIRRGRRTLPDHKLLEIMDDERDPSTIWRESDTGKSRAWIDQVHRGATSLARRLKEYGRAALHEEEAIYWWDSEERGRRIKRLVSGDLPDYSHDRKRPERENYAG